jgi:hypothetical protein
MDPRGNVTRLANKVSLSDARVLDPDLVLTVELDLRSLLNIFKFINLLS